MPRSPAVEAVAGACRAALRCHTLHGVEGQAWRCWPAKTCCASVSCTNVQAHLWIYMCWPTEPCQIPAPHVHHRHSSHLYLQHSAAQLPWHILLLCCKTLPMV